MISDDPLKLECKQAFCFFLPHEEITALEPLGKGLINDTWLAVVQSGEKYVLQRLNAVVFPDLGFVQNNVCRVTNHLRAGLAANPANTGFTVFQVIRNPAGKSAYIDKTGSWWRLLSYIENSKTLHSITRIEQAEEIGAALGLFHRLVSSLPPASLTDPLPGFHDTPLYLAKYDALPPSVQKNDEDCRNFIDKHRKDVHLLKDAQKRGDVTRQVVHGDPKVSNFLFFKDGKQVISLIDLDTVRPGLLLHDIGDCLRSCCNPRGEAALNPDDIIFDQDLFSAVLNGYLSNAVGLLTSEDRRLIVDSVRLICFELGLRFYSDYLAGNPYFKVAYPEQNLFRAKTQFALVRSIENQYNALVDLLNFI